MRGSLSPRAPRRGWTDTTARRRACSTGPRQAAEDKRIAGAALDVIEGEPDVVAAHPLLEAARRMPNLIVTPHIGGCTGESRAKTERFLAQRLVALLSAALDERE